MASYNESILSQSKKNTVVPSATQQRQRQQQQQHQQEAVTKNKIGSWTCPYCTFLHQFHATRCQMCDKLRGPSKEQMIDFIHGKPIPNEVRIDPLLLSSSSVGIQQSYNTNNNNSAKATTTTAATTISKPTNPYAKKKNDPNTTTTEGIFLSQQNGKQKSTVPVTNFFKKDKSEKLNLFYDQSQSSDCVFLSQDNLPIHNEGQIQQQSSKSAILPSSLQSNPYSKMKASNQSSMPLLPNAKNRHETIAPTHSQVKNTTAPLLSQKTLFDTKAVVVKNIPNHEGHDIRNKENNDALQEHNFNETNRETIVVQDKVTNCIVIDEDDKIQWTEIPIDSVKFDSSNTSSLPVLDTRQTSTNKANDELTNEFDDITSDFFNVDLFASETRNEVPNLAPDRQPINPKRPSLPACDSNNQPKRLVNDTIKWSNTTGQNKIGKRPIRLSGQFLPYTPGPVAINLIHATTWIYPADDEKYPQREYQVQMTESAIFHNTLVSLPTGLGKTLIAAVVMYNYYRWFDSGIVLFLAPTLPLVHQQVRACYDIMGIPQCDTHILTGKTKSSERAGAWGNRRVFFCTPQTVQNDLESGSVDATRVVCVVLDEVHKATGKYSYTQVVELLEKKGAKFRLLGLSATPGTNIKSIQQVLDALKISKIEFRQDSDPDVAKYIHDRKSEDIFVEQDEVQKVVLKSLNELIVTVIDTLRKTGVCDLPPSVDSISAYTLIIRQKEFQQRSNDQYVIGHLLCAARLLEVRTALSSHGIGVVRTKLQALKDNSNHGIIKHIVKKPAFLALWEQVQAASFDSQQQRSGTISVADRTQNNPKLRLVREILLEHFARKKATGDSTRAIVFSEFRESVFEIVAVLALSDELKPRHFIGQSNGKDAKSKKQAKKSQKSSEIDDEVDDFDPSDIIDMSVVTEAKSKQNVGMNQKEQQQVIQDFQRGMYNILVCTCIGEEGLDIGEVDLIINFDVLRSPIRMLQRVGRTGRKREGRVVSLILEGAEKRKFLDSKQKEKTLAHALRNPKSFTVYPSVSMFADVPKMEAKNMIIASKFSFTQVNYEVGTKRRIKCNIDHWCLTAEEDSSRRLRLGDVLASVRLEQDRSEQNDAICNSRLPRALTRRLIGARVESMASTKSRSQLHRSKSRMPTIRGVFTSSFSKASHRYRVKSEMDVLFPLGDNCIANYKVTSRIPVTTITNSLPTSGINWQTVDVVNNGFKVEDAKFGVDSTSHPDVTSNTIVGGYHVATPTEIDTLEVPASWEKHTSFDNLDLENGRMMSAASPPQDSTRELQQFHHVDIHEEIAKQETEKIEDIPFQDFVLPLSNDDSSSDGSIPESNVFDESNDITCTGTTSLQIAENDNQREPILDEFCLPLHYESSDDDSDSKIDDVGEICQAQDRIAVESPRTAIDFVLQVESLSDKIETNREEIFLPLARMDAIDSDKPNPSPGTKLPSGKVRFQASYDSDSGCPVLCRGKNKRMKNVIDDSPSVAANTDIFKKEVHMSLSCTPDPSFALINRELKTIESIASYGSEAIDHITYRGNQKQKIRRLAIEDSPSYTGDSICPLKAVGQTKSPTPDNDFILCNTQFETDIVCAVCQSAESPDEDPIILCDGTYNGISCNLAVHVTCYAAVVDIASNDPWLCDVCTYRQNGGNGFVQCHICNLSKGALKIGSNNIWQHVNCDVTNKHFKTLKRKVPSDVCDAGLSKEFKVDESLDSERQLKEKRRRAIAKKFFDEEAAIHSDDDMDGDDSEVEDVAAIEEDEAKMTAFINDSSQLGYSPDNLECIDPPLLDDEGGVHRSVDAARDRMLQYATPIFNRRMQKKNKGVDCTPASAPSSQKGLGNMHFIRSVLEHHRNGGSCKEIENIYKKIEAGSEQQNSSSETIQDTISKMEAPVLMEYVLSDSEESV